MLEHGGVYKASPQLTGGTKKDLLIMFVVFMPLLSQNKPHSVQQVWISLHSDKAFSSRH